MMDYSLNVTKLANRLIPHFVRKPVHKAFVHALLAPLGTVNRALLEFVAEKRVEANMNSQTMLLESYLNRTFAGHFRSPSDRIEIIHSTSSGLPVYLELEEGVIDPVVYNASEAYQADQVHALDFTSERAGSLPYNFRVSLPAHFEERRDLVGGVVSLIEKYMIGGFGYDIVYR